MIRTSENNFTALPHFCLLYGEIKSKNNNDTNLKRVLNISDRCTHVKTDGIFGILRENWTK